MKKQVPFMLPCGCDYSHVYITAYHKTTMTIDSNLDINGVKPGGVSYHIQCTEHGYVDLISGTNWIEGQENLKAWFEPFWSKYPIGSRRYLDFVLDGNSDYPLLPGWFINPGYVLDRIFRLQPDNSDNPIIVEAILGAREEKE